MIISKCLEYQTLPWSFYILTFSGVWCPSDWRPAIKLLYRSYTVIQSIGGALFWITMIINLAVTRTESEYFYENLFAISTLTYAMYKEYFILKKRKVIEDFIKLCYNDEWYIPQDVHEREIIAKYEYETRCVTQAYAIGIVAGLATKAITPMLKSDAAWVLPIEAWYPYDTKNMVNYLLSYVQQLIGGIPLICLHISVDSLFVGIVLQMCIQLKLLKRRLQTFATYANMDQEKDLRDIDVKLSDSTLANYANKHECILNFGRKVNAEFVGIMTGQVMITIPNICINVYLLSQHRGAITLHLIDSFFCFGTCLMQIFLYCWYGNKIILHSLDVANAAYEMNWLCLHISSKKKLLTMMVRTTRSIQFAAGTFVMNVDSFIEIIKTSYSAFRVLQRTSG